MRGLSIALLALAMALPMTSGCHAKFKKAAPTLGEVKTRTMGVRQPNVELAGSNLYTADNILEDVVAVYQMGKEAELERRIFQAVDPDAVAWALEDGVANSLGEGPPFAWTGDQKRGHVLQLEIMEYGVEVPRMGAQGDFVYRVRMRIYTEQAERVYSARVRCEAPLGDPEIFSVAFGGVNNTRQLNQMTDGQLQAAFEAMARHCGDRIVAKMRRHAG